MTVGKSDQHVFGLFQKPDTELVRMYGPPATMRMHADGNVERVWNVDSGQLHVMHNNEGKVADVKFFNNVTSDEMHSMVQHEQA